MKNKFSGIDIVPEVVRLAAMNLNLHGITGVESIVEAKDALMGAGGRSYDIILTNPPWIAPDVSNMAPPSLRMRPVVLIAIS